MTDLKHAPEWEQGRVGEILQYGWYRVLGTELADLADRTEKRAPLLHGPNATMISPDTLARKSAPFFLEFKTKSHHQQWGGGGPNDIIRWPKRIEEGIDEDKSTEYGLVELRWKMPVVLSFLAIREATIIAAPLQQLNEPRPSADLHYPILNWDIRNFNLIASFDPKRLWQFFKGKEPKLKAARERWVQAMPPFSEVQRVLDWLRPQQAQFAVLQQFIFDQTERDWHAPIPLELRP